MPTVLKQLRYAFEGIIASFFYFFFWLIGMNAASWLGGKIARLLGPFLKVQRTAEKNVAAALPELSEKERKKIIGDMWENLGRVMGEAPHAPSLTGKRFEKHISLEGTEYLSPLKNPEKGAIIFSGHFANWELGPKTAFEFGVPMVVMYRRANNPWVEKLYRFTRRKSHVGLYQKGKEGAIASVRALKEKKVLALLLDQKMNEGIPVPFFGRDAMTAQAAAEFALKFKCPLIPARVIRIKGTQFRVQLFPPLLTENKTVPEIMREVNATFESWIRQYPAQWMWVHNRWPKN